MSEMVNNYGWHLVDRQWILGSRQPGDAQVHDPKAVIEKRDGIWYWRLIGEEAWHMKNSFNEAMTSANEAVWRLAEN